MAFGGSAQAGSHGRGGGRLLHDCAVVGRMLAANRASAVVRLEAEVGVELAALLRSGLSGNQARPHGWQATVEATKLAPTRERTRDCEAEVRSLRSVSRRMMLLHPERPTAVWFGVGRSSTRRMVSRLGAQEARVRKAALNERIQHGTRKVPDVRDRIELVCECCDETCTDRIVLTEDEYAFLRTVSGFYAVSFDHVSPDDHIIVGEVGRYAIVE